MAVNTFRIYEDGYDSTDFVSDPDVTLLSWSPAVVSRRSGGLGGRGPYNDAVEELTIGIAGTSASDLLNNLEDLRILLDRAERWALGEPGVGPVLFQYEPDAGSQVLSTVIYGPPEPGQPMIELPPNFMQTPGIQYIDNILLRFRRSGAWLEPDEAKTEADSSANNPGLMSVTFNTTSTLPCPTKLELSFSNLPDSSSIVVLVAQSSSHLDVVDAEDAGAGGNYSVVTDSNASGGEIMRFTPNDTNAALLSLTTALDTDVRRVAIVASIKNRSSTISYTLRGFAETSYTRYTTIGTADNDPQMVVLGTVVTRGAITAFGIEVTASTTGTVANSLDIDTVSIVALDDDVGRVLVFPDIERETTINHATLSKPSPQVTVSTDDPVPYRGDIYLNQIGATFAAAVVGNTGSNWRVRNSATAVTNIGMTATRNYVRLTPF